MDNTVALSRLGLTGPQDPARIAHAYSECLAAIQGRLVSAQTDADREHCHTQLAELVEAYEFVTTQGRSTRANVTPFKVIRSGSDRRAHDTAVRMEPGAVLSDRLEIGELLGQGGMGNVYAAHDRLKQENVAIKVLRQDLLHSSAAKERFLAEARVSCNLSHPNIVRVHDVGLSGDYYYLSMERLAGQTLRQRIETYRREQRKFDVAEVRTIARQLVDALNYAHRYIVHRDLKPENIWLALDGTVKLMDFGIARAYSNSQLTQTGVTLGTAYYMAPEQRAASKEVDWRADQYSLGVVLYELLAGEVPMGAVRPLEKLRKDVPIRLAHALMRTMAPQPEDRFASMDALLLEIEADPKKAPNAVVGFSIAAVALVAFAAGAFILKEPSTPPAATDAPSANIVAPIPTSDEAATANETIAGAAPADADVAVSPTEPPPPPPDPVASATLVESRPPENSSSPTTTTSRAAMPTPVQSAAKRERVAVVDSSVQRREQCVAQCERDDGECRSIGRRGKQECMRGVAFGATGAGITPQTNSAASSCGFFGGARCEYAVNRDACMARIASRYQECVNVLSGSVTSRRQDCDATARDSDQLCLAELRECRSSCQ